MSFRLKTILGVALIQAILLLILIFNSLDYLRTSNEQELIKRIHSTSSLVASAVKDAVISKDIEGLDNSISELIHSQPDLLYARVIDETGLHLTEAGNSELLAVPFHRDIFFSEVKDKTFDTEVEIKEDEHPYGVVQIGFATTQIDNLLQNAHERAATIAILGLLLTGLFSFLLGSYLTRQLRIMTQASQRISAGDLGYQIQIVGRDELAQTASAFNRMSSKLRQTYSELQNTLTNAKKTTAELREQENHFRKITETIECGILTTNAEGTILTCNPASNKMFALDTRDLIGRPVGQLFAKGEFEKHIRVPPNIRRKRKSSILFNTDTELQVRGIRECSENQVFPLKTTISIFSNGESPIFLFILVDSTEQHQALTQVKKLYMALGHCDNTIMITDAEGGIEYVNNAFIELCGYTEEELIGKNARMLKSGHHDDQFYQRLWKNLREGKIFQDIFINKKKDGSTYHEEKTITPYCNSRDEIKHFIAVGRDISDRLNSESQLSYSIHYDALTGLPNHRLFDDRIRQALIEAERYERIVAIMLLDIDHFKSVNDSLGHDVGDLLLKSIAERLKRCVRAGDTVARRSSDEFAILLTNLALAQDASIVAGKIFDTLSEPFLLAKHELFVTPSLGIALYPKDTKDPGILIRNADAAMLRAKQQGRNNYQFYSNENGSFNLSKGTMLSDLRRAIQERDLNILVQPKVSAKDKHINEVELIPHWQHKDHGDVNRDSITTVAEQTGLIKTLASWLLEVSFSKAAQWRGEKSKVNVAIKLSARNLLDDQLPEKIDGLLKRYELDPATITIEYTENTLINSPERAFQVLRAISGIGIKQAIKDFGIGYTSLLSLKRLPISMLKIHASFIQNIADNDENASIVHSAIDLAHDLGCLAGGEGVDSNMAYKMLESMHCDQLQGDFICPPIVVEQFEQWMKSGERYWYEGQTFKSQKTEYEAPGLNPISTSDIELDVPPNQ